MKRFFWLSIIVVIIVGAGVWLFGSLMHKPAPAGATVSTEYRCSGGKSIVSALTDKGVKLTLSDGRTLALTAVAGTSKYVDATGIITFQATKYAAFLEESGRTTYLGCTIYPLPF